MEFDRRWRGPRRPLLLVIGSLTTAIAQCPSGQHSYVGGGPYGCSPCSSGATFTLPTASCVPATAPTDTAFYLSGTSDEGIAAFYSQGATQSFVADHLGAYNGAVNIQSGSYSMPTGSPSQRDGSLLPGIGSDYSMSAWVNCQAAAQPGPMSVVLDWGYSSSISLGDASPHSNVLAVGAAGNNLASGDVVVTTLAGGAAVGAIDGTGTDARFTSPSAVAVSATSGVVAVADSNFIRLITPLGVVSTLAGSSVSGSADGAGTAAQFQMKAGVYQNGMTLPPPIGLAFDDTNNNLVFADRGNHLIRLISPSGLVSTLAGNFTYSYYPTSYGPNYNPVGGYADGTGTNAQFNGPTGIALLPSGTAVVADSYNGRIRLVSPSGVVSTLAGCGTGCNGGFADGTGTAASFDMPCGVAVRSAGSQIAVMDQNNNILRLVSYPDGRVSTVALIFNAPSGVAALQSMGALIVADTGSSAIRLVSNLPGGRMSALAGVPGSPGSSLADGAGNVALFSGPLGVAVGALSNLVAVADAGTNSVRLIALPVIPPVCDGSWHHVATTYSQSAQLSLSAFVDGALWVQQAQQYTSTGQVFLSVGGQTGTNVNNFIGAMSDIRLYTRALSTTEIVLLRYVGMIQPTMSPLPSSSTSLSPSPSPLVTMPCSGSTYSYGSGACSPCAAGATFVSVVAGCMPSTGPTDTAFYLSGTQTEGLAAFPPPPLFAPAFVSDHLGAPSGALYLPPGPYQVIQLEGSYAPSTIPSDNTFSFSASAWVNFPPVLGQFSAIYWGNGNLGSSYSIVSGDAIALVVNSVGASSSASYLPACNGLQVR